MAGYQEIVTPSGVVVKVERFEEHNVIDIRARSGEQLIFMAAVTPGGWARFKKSIAAAERLMIQEGWLENPSPGAEGAPILQMVKSE